MKEEQKRWCRYFINKILHAHINFPVFIARSRAISISHLMQANEPRDWHTRNSCKASCMEAFMWRTKCIFHKSHTQLRLSLTCTDQVALSGIYVPGSILDWHSTIRRLTALISWVHYLLAWYEALTGEAPDSSHCKIWC